MDLESLLRRPESKTLEFKREVSSPEGALRTIVAFANTAGGTLLIGVEDVTRNIRGVPEPLDLEERLASLISDSIAPRLFPEIEIMPWRRTHVLAIQIHPSSARPHQLSARLVPRAVSQQRDPQPSDNSLTRPSPHGQSASWRVVLVRRAVVWWSRPRIRVLHPA